MKKYNTLFFDVDGTLFDSSEGVHGTFDFVFDKFGINVPRQDYRHFIGPPIRDSLGRYFDGEILAAAHEMFREQYLANGKFRAKLYDGIVDVLAYVKNKGYKVYTATSKGENPAREIIEKFGILEYFDEVYGADTRIGRAHKDQVLEYALKKSGADPMTSLLIGDTKYDVIGSKTVGMDCLAVSYGFGSKDELFGENVIGVAEKAADIISMI